MKNILMFMVYAAISAVALSCVRITIVHVSPKDEKVRIEHSSHPHDPMHIYVK